MTCLHPEACRDSSGACRWCDEVGSLRHDLNALTHALESQAVIVRDGSANIEGPVGYLAVYGGAVYLGESIVVGRVVASR